MAAQDFLFEIGTEELPPTSLPLLMESFENFITQELKNHKLDHKNIKVFITPRRLAVLITALASKQPEQVVEKRGPALKAAFDSNGNPTKATLGFAKSCNTTVNKLEQVTTSKGEWLFYNSKQAGKTALELMPAIISDSLKALPIPKLMRWHQGEQAFIRPVHWLVMLYGNKIIKTSLFGLTTSNKTHGHRFHAPAAITIEKPAQYEALLKKHRVIVDFKTRKESIKTQINNLAKTHGSALIIEELLTEVTGLVEWPVALIGEFPERFLTLPQEVLILTLQKHQKCFAIKNKNNLQPFFITISNIASKNKNQVIKGNERVINARLTDAEFFYNNDLKNPLENNLEKLKETIFQVKLGSIYDKTIRVGRLALDIAKQLKLNLTHTQRAALLAKTDLVSEMVFEFPELQGTMGYYYATAQKESSEVALALQEQYLPRFANDRIPTSTLGAALAIADRLDTIVGIFGINQAPTGTKDPFALRRAALGVLRISIEKELDLDLNLLLREAIANYHHQLPNNEVYRQTLEFIMERLRAWYSEQGVTPQIFGAVFATCPTRPLDFAARIAAVQAFLKLPEAESLAAANKRVSNILNKSGVTDFGAINDNLLQDTAEKSLAKKLASYTKTVTPLYEQGDYTAALTKLAELKPTIDKFFDQVMVMAEQEELRNNRLALLARLRALFLYAADISLLQ